MFTEKDIEQFRSAGVADRRVNTQIDNFISGFPYLPVKAVATIGDGIIRYSEEEVLELVKEYDSLIKRRSMVKFVPASGAATRMFKELYEYVNEDKESEVIKQVLARIGEFAFADKITENEPKKIISQIIEEGLNYGKLPKGLVLFHKYDEGSRTALEEHIAEGAMYARTSDGEVNIHFTVSPEHQQGFETLVSAVKESYQQKYNVKINISYSQQKKSTDTIAVDMDNNPFREDDGTILLRPAGHGALLENLNDIDADIIFIKNIDNVVPDRLKNDTVIYKKVLAATLLKRQQECFSYLLALRMGANEALLEEIEEFVREDLLYKFKPGLSSRTVGERAKELKAILNRPMRVCAMVKNEGEPGGGPFWVRNSDGSQSLQIAESSQISPDQKKLMTTSTHFNPADLVCGVRNMNNKKFDLRQYSDPKTGFISKKSKNGRDLKAQELPGLWNGAMAKWNTIFVEVPVSTFNPVKSIVDLLREQHR